jgi:hypothetical protein
MFLLPKKLPHCPKVITQKDILKLKYIVSVIISPVTATMAKHDELQLWIHTLDILLSG